MQHLCTVLNVFRNFSFEYLVLQLFEIRQEISLKILIEMLLIQRYSDYRAL